MFLLCINGLSIAAIVAVTGSDLTESLALEIIVSSEIFDNQVKYGISLGLNKYFQNNSRKPRIK